MLESSIFVSLSAFGVLVCEFFSVISSERSCLAYSLLLLFRDMDSASESVTMTILSFRFAFSSISFVASLMASSSAVMMLMSFVIFGLFLVRSYCCIFATLLSYLFWSRLCRSSCGLGIHCLYVLALWPLVY